MSGLLWFALGAVSGSMFSAVVAGVRGYAQGRRAALDHQDTP